MQLPNAGTHRARLGGQIVIYETGEGALCAAIPVAIQGEGWVWTGKHTATIVKKDGTIQTKTVDTLKQVFGWDGLDPFWLMDADLSQAEFDVVGEHEEYTPDEGEPRMQFKIKWLNAPGASGMRMPEAADRKSVLAKFGTQFRALSGAKPAAAAKPKATPKQEGEAEPELPAAPTPPKKGSPPAAKKAPGKTAGGQPPTATMEEAWQALCTANPKMSEDKQGELWYAKLDEMFPGVQPADLSIQQWGQVKLVFES